MPYTYKKEASQYCVYKKDTGEKVGCTDGNREALNRYLAAIHTNVKKEAVAQQIENLREARHPPSRLRTAIARSIKS